MIAPRSPKPQTRARYARARYAKVMDQCRDMAVIFSNAQLADLFEHAGTAFLDFAERAENNALQSRFFEAMGLIQRRRTDIEHVFRQEIDQGFENFGCLGTAAYGVAPDDSDGEGFELSLVDQEDMEQYLAAEHVIIKANANFFPELYALSQRLAIVNGGRKLKDYEIPAAPHHLVHAFQHSIEGLEVADKIKVVLYALFDKFVVTQAKSLYDELNGNLKDAGILPNLRAMPVGAERPPAHPNEDDQQAQADADAAEQAPTSLGEELFETIVDLMSKRHGTRYGEARRKAPQTAAEREAAAAASQDLVAAIGRAQSEATPDRVHAKVAEAAQIPKLQIDIAFIEKVKETLGQEREHVLSQIDRDKLSPMDADLIDLIGMLFEYMLNDPVLPNLAKALLSHLHTPYLKVALIDRRLLVDERHFARQLLDKMVEAGSLWVDENNPQRGIFRAMQRIVDRVLQEFSDDVTLFEELVATFEQSMEEQRRKTDTMEQRTQEAARGREKLQIAKQRANQLIQELLGRTPLPVPAANFLSKTWLDQLVFILLRNEDGDRSDAWKEAAKTAEDLAALFEPEAGAAMSDVHTEVIANVRKRITDGVNRMGSYTHSALDALLVLLDAPETWQELRAKAAATRKQEADAEKAPEALPARTSREATRGEVYEQEQEVVKRLSKMKFGTWFEFASSTGGVPRRIKLSWLSPLTSTCMFVDRSGMQAEIKTLQELAHEILSGRAKVISRPKHPFIERALVSIRKMLQSDEGVGPGADAPQRQ